MRKDLINLTLVRQTKLALNADQWQLFTSMEGAEGAATALNTAFDEAVNLSNNEVDPRGFVRRRMNAAMTEKADFGACDSEPYHTLDDLLDAVFGEER